MKKQRNKRKKKN